MRHDLTSEYGGWSYDDGSGNNDEGGNSYPDGYGFGYYHVGGSHGYGYPTEAPGDTLTILELIAYAT